MLTASFVFQMLDHSKGKTVIMGQGDRGLVVGSSGSKGLVIPPYSEWIVKMWHFGSDASIEYSGERFEVSFGVGQEALIRAYSKQMKNHKTGLGWKAGEPNAPLADVIDENFIRILPYIDFLRTFSSSLQFCSTAIITLHFIRIKGRM